MIHPIYQKNNSRPLKSSKNAENANKYTIVTCIDYLKSFLSTLDNPDPLTILKELERMYKLEIDGSKENIIQPKMNIIKQDLEGNRIAYNKLFDRYDKENEQLKAEIVNIKNTFALNIQEKNNEIERLQTEIQKNLKYNQEKVDYRDTLLQCQALEQSMNDIMNKYQKYQEKIQNQEVWIAQITQKNSKLITENEKLKNEVIIIQEKNRNMVKTFEKSLLQKAQNYKERTLSLLNCKSASKIEPNSKSFDSEPKVIEKNDYLSPRLIKKYQDILVSPPTFQNLNKGNKNITPEILNQVKLRLPQEFL